MDETDVRERAEAMCAALVDGDIARATEDFSRELQQHLGEVVSLLPLPATAATVESIDRGASSGFTVVLLLLGENEEVRVQTRWKDRDGRPTVVEASHLSRVETLAADATGEGDTPADDETA
jgi:hypothetical protein